MSLYFTDPRFVYFIRPIGMDGPVKIGCSYVPRSRLVSLMAYSPVPLEIAATADGSVDDEQRMHSAFAADHSHREWFRFTPRLGAVIERVKAGESIDSILADIDPSGSANRAISGTQWSVGRRAYHSATVRLIAAAARAGRQTGVKHYVPNEVREMLKRIWKQDREATGEEAQIVNDLCDRPTDLMRVNAPA